MRKSIGETTTLNGKTLSSFLSFPGGAYKTEQGDFNCMDIISLPSEGKYEILVIGQIRIKENEDRQDNKAGRYVKMEIERTTGISEDEFMTEHFNTVSRVKKIYLGS